MCSQSTEHSTLCSDQSLLKRGIRQDGNGTHLNPSFVGRKITNRQWSSIATALLLAMANGTHQLFAQIRRELIVERGRGNTVFFTLSNDFVVLFEEAGNGANLIGECGTAGTDAGDQWPRHATREMAQHYGLGLVEKKKIEHTQPYTNKGTVWFSGRQTQGQTNQEQKRKTRTSKNNTRRKQKTFKRERWMRNARREPLLHVPVRSLTSASNCVVVFLPVPPCWTPYVRRRESIPSNVNTRSQHQPTNRCLANKNPNPNKCDGGMTEGMVGSWKHEWGRILH